MKRPVAYLFFISLAAAAAAQVNVSGTVVEDGSGAPMPGASVVYRNAEGRISKFATSGSGGDFSLSVPSLEGCRLEVSMMGYARKTAALDSVTLPLTVIMSAEALQLKEVAVKADRIREQGDTVTYTVGGFAQKHDRTIGDVLARMPGIDVDKSGKIKYQGEDINRFYIEGSDLLGGKYGVATKGISHEDVGAVEVMENHQPLQVLSGISFSDKAAINLKLKNKAKTAWSIHGNAAAGYSQQPGGILWDAGIFTMAAQPSFQNITTLKSNNCGEMLASGVTDFFDGRHETDISPYVGIALPAVPNLNRRRTLFNRSLLASVNNLWKKGGGELKLQLDYTFDRLAAGATNRTTYFLDDGDKIITESRDATDRSHSLSAKATYELNKKTAFINNTLRAAVGWNDTRLAMTGSMPNTQSASLPDYYVSNRLKIIRRFKDRHLVTFQSHNEWESLPQTLTVGNSASTMRQHVADMAFYTRESAAYTLIVRNVTISLEGGLKGYLRKMDSDFSVIPVGTEAVGQPLTNVISTNCLTVYARPSFEYRLRRVNFTLDTPVSFAAYSFDKAIANRSGVYFSPSLKINWKPDNRFSASLNGSTGRSPMNLSLIHPEPVMTDYRSLCRGVDDFYNTSSHNITGAVSYKQIRLGLFADAFAIQSWNSLPFTMIQQLYGDYVVYSYSTARNNSRSLTAGGNIGKTLDFIRGSINLKGSFSRSDSHMISRTSAVNSVTTSWSAGVKTGGSATRWLSFDYSIGFSATRLAMNAIKASWLDKIENTLLINIIPHQKWEWHISGEHYRNEISDGRYKNAFLLDTRLLYKIGKRIDLSAAMTNILDRRNYSYTVYNTLTSFESQRHLRGREFLISITLRK